MRRKSYKVFLTMLLAFLLAFSSIPAQASNNAVSSDETLAAEAVAQLPQEMDTSLISCTKTQLTGNISKYSYVLRVGSGEYDKIGVYRVVKTNLNGTPIPASRSVMMVHGASSNFDNSFLTGTVSDKIPEDQSIGFYMAQNNIDVWGIDFRWTLIPATETDLSFMRDWDTSMKLDDLEIAIKLARIIRSLTGSGSGKIFLLGHSMGALLTYAYANAETQLPETLTDIKGIIPMDIVFKTSPEDPDLKQASYDRYQALKALYDSGTSYSDKGKNLSIIAGLAATAPDDPSPIMPGLTNKQASIFILSSTYATYAPLQPDTPFYHYLAGSFDEYGIPTGYQYANFDLTLDIGLATPAYQSLAEIIDNEALTSDAVDLPYDDHLADIEIPIFYVGAAGGFGEYGAYTTSLLGSADNCYMIVQLHSSEEVALDYGHNDLLWSGNAEALVWSPILDWINCH